MMIMAWFILALLLVVLAVTLFNAFTAPRLIRGPRPRKPPRTSVLIPARNESDSITGCLESLLKQDYPDFEIVVLDDASTDGTLRKVRDMSEKHPKIRVLRGRPLPPGWTGKNWACHQLSREASGDLLIFTDADTRAAETILSRTAGWMEKLNLDLVSAFPQQETVTLAEKLVVPTVYMTVYCYLPLWLTYYLPFSSLAAANGQWLVLTRTAYQKLKAHETAKNEIVEDTWIARYAKKQNLKILTTAGTAAVSGRMYRGWSEVVEGFSKNLYGLMAYQTLPFILLLVFMCVAYISPFALLFYKPLLRFAAAALLINLIIRLTLVLKYRDSVLSLILHPVAIGMTVWIGLKSMIRFRSGRLEWKGRTLNTKRT